MKKNNWEKRFGAKRRAIDKALLAECERQIVLPKIKLRLTGTGAGTKYWYQEKCHDV